MTSEEITAAAAVFTIAKQLQARAHMETERRSDMSWQDEHPVADFVPLAMEKLAQVHSIMTGIKRR